MERRRHYIYPDKDTLVAAFVCEVSKFLTESKELKRPVHIALSGGSTPLAVFSQLRATTTREDWSNVHLYWGDERCVNPRHDESNYGSASNLLIKPLGISAEQVHRIKGEEVPRPEAKRYSDLLMDQLPVENGMPVFDWVWLGMGEDGHTASIFPDQIEHWNSIEPCAVAIHPSTGQKRITITGNFINAARRITFLVTGKDKATIVNEIVMKEGKYMEYPAFYVAPSTGDLEWYLDQDATSWL